MKELKGIIFDLDGVITDTAKYHFIAWQECAASVGFSFGEKENEQLKGVSRIGSLEMILEWAGVQKSEEEKLAMANAKNESYLKLIEDLSSADILPGIHELIVKSRNEGIILAVGSASKNAKMILRKLGLFQYFQAIVDGGSVEKGKPNPEVFLTAVRLIDKPVDSCVVIEDAAAGIEAANRGGFASVGIGDEFELSGATVILDSTAGLSLSMLRSIIEHD